METNLIVKPFAELTNSALLALLFARNQVFIVEQGIQENEIDSHDLVAYHVMRFDEKDQIVAYARVYQQPQGVTFGRVLTMKGFRKHGLGRQIVKDAITTALQKFPQQPLTISAQAYLKKFYQSLGFVPVSSEYLEVGIKHLKMQYAPTDSGEA
ncbi:GNAT family N-acetyltransferase [Fructilactobacillus florum]|uniref:GNAT family N-acetyltransferase n=1 Tax=Fructilactobacillus florum TaxID=640331 RepID=UPI00028C3E6D|nr:GNAT family N-acetyltransferase [Fructilactobacillus florum]EKK20139.1 GCN5-related N-acetyltransferase [Fructilactobacillus florum 2F]